MPALGQALPDPRRFPSGALEVEEVLAVCCMQCLQVRSAGADLGRTPASNFGIVERRFGTWPSLSLSPLAHAPGSTVERKEPFSLLFAISLVDDQLRQGRRDEPSPPATG